jgi:nucleotide-binding universal stress UspA family protein
MSTQPGPYAITSILLPLDGSSRAELALPAAILLAGHLEARVQLLHIVEREAPAAVHGERHLGSAGDANAYLSGIADRLRADGLTVSIHVHDDPERDVTQSIAVHATELDADLVMLVAHGEGGWRNLVFGRVAQQVALHGSRPALVLQDRADGRLAPFPPSKIAVLLDGPADIEGEAVLPVTIALARALDAGVRLITSIPAAELSTERGPVATLLPSATRALSDIERDAAVRYLEERVDSLRNAGIETTAVVLRGEPSEEVLPEAKRAGADMLAIVTHPRSPLSGMLSGSVAARALTSWGGALLIVRSPEEAK